MEQYRQVLYDRSQPLERFLSDIAQHYGIPAVAAATITLDGIQSQAAAGVRDASRSEPVDVSDVFFLASCTKPLTATLVAVLIQDHVLEWDTRPVDVLAGLEDVIHPRFRGITVKQLLSHTAGVGSFTSDREFFGVADVVPGLQGTTVEQRRAFAVWNLRRPPVVVPGTYLYSNAGYVIAAAMIEEITGTSWESLMKQRVFEPLGLPSACIGTPQAADAAAPARHALRDSTGMPVPLGVDERATPPVLYPACGVWMSVTDFARFTLFHYRGLNGRDGLLPAAAVEYLHRPVAAVSTAQAYGLGWEVFTLGEIVFSSHVGSEGSTYAGVVVGRRRGAKVVVANMGDQRAAAACTNVLMELPPR